MAIPETPGERLRALMKERGIGNAAVAEAAGVHVKTVSQWLNDRFMGGPSDENMAPVAKLLGTTVAYIRYGAENGSRRIGEPSARFTLSEFDLPRQLRLMALDFEREALQMGADDAFMRYVRTSFSDPDFVALFAGGPDESPMTAEQAVDEMHEHIRELRALLKRRLARSREQSGKLAPGLDE